MLDENLHWILSFYRTSEISGALFFGELAKRLKPSSIQADMTRHFADEANHARYWTDCLAKLGAEPLKLGDAYQDQYLAKAGMPCNLMEVLAITHVFEKRVVSQYSLHKHSPETPTVVVDTLANIMFDERWHIEWVSKALDDMAEEYGADEVQATLRRYTEADREVYQHMITEHTDRLKDVRLAAR